MRKLCVGCLIGYILVIGILTFVWSGKEHLTNDTYDRIEVSMEKEKDYLGYTELFDYIMKDEDVFELTDLEKNSDVIVKAKLKDRKFVGEGVINECEIMQVYKGFDQKHTIFVYDDVPWNESAHYFEGAVPLHEGDEYIMFLKPAPNANVEDSYIFTSVSYGHFRLKEDVKFLTYDMDNKINVQEASRYDHIAFDDRNFETFKKFQGEVYAKYK